MLIDTSTATALGATVAAFIAGAWGVFMTRKASEAALKADAATDRAKDVSVSDLAKTNAELADAYRAKAAEWKLAFEQEHAENVAYHNWVHEKANTDNATLLKLTEENALLRARTDLTPIIEHMAAQSQANERVVDMLGKLSVAIEHLLDRISSDK